MTADAITRRAVPGYWACEPAGGGPPVCRFSMIACALGAWEASMRGMGSDAHDPISGGSPVTAGPSASADFWEPRFQAADPSWGREPSARLVELLPGLGLAPGRAWDLGCAHGGRAPETPSPQQTLTGLDVGPGWQAETCERADRVAAGPDGQTATVTDNVIVLRRH
jgi:hypothetical protein